MSDKTHFSEMIARANLFDISLTVHSLFAKDSLEMNDEDREQVVEACAKTSEEEILVAHGTDTMVETATVVARHLEQHGIKKRVVFFGAMIPYENSRSDALFNLGTAIMAVQIVETGVFVAMNGQLFPWNFVRKNREKGVFEKLTTS